MVRVKRRYFVFQFHFDPSSNSNALQSVKPSQIHQSFEGLITRLYGDYGAACFTRNLSIIYYNPATHLCIVRCLRDDKHLLQTTATFLTRLADPPIQCSLQTLHVSGSIRLCKKYLVNYSIEQLVMLDRLAENSSPSTSEHLFKKKKRKNLIPLQNPSFDIDQKKKISLQKLLSDSRMESMTTIESKETE